MARSGTDGDIRTVLAADSRRRLICQWYFVSWWQWSLGLTVDWTAPNLEVHLPFGFLRLGRECPVNCATGGRWRWEPAPSHAPFSYRTSQATSVATPPPGRRS